MRKPTANATVGVCLITYHVGVRSLATNFGHSGAPSTFIDNPISNPNSMARAGAATKMGSDRTIGIGLVVESLSL